MMNVPLRSLALLSIALFLSTTVSHAGRMMLVDGTVIQGEVLFQHPNAPLLVLRSSANRTAQSLPLSLIHAFEREGKAQTVSPRRELTKEEKTMLQRNSLWGDDVGEGQIGNYAKQEWEKRPLLVWSKPGESGDATLAESWLDENGQALTAPPFAMDERIERRKTQGALGHFDGDILLPAADEPYEAIAANGQFVFRHLTVEKGAVLATRYVVLGNVWVKDGGGMINSGTGSMGCFGGRAIGRVASNFAELGHDRHIFIRFCNYHDLAEPTFAYGEPISHWFHFDAGEGSLEIIGQTRGGADRVNYGGGTIIFSKNSHFGSGDRASAAVHEKATIILLDGASFGNHFALSGGSAGNRMGTYGIAGTLLFGTPEKPLTRDLYFGATYYPEELIDPKGRSTDRAFGASYILGETGKMVIHSADPSKARVVFRPHPREWQVSRGAPAGDEFWAKPDMPQGIAALFRGETDFNGVMFDGFYEGGILVDPKARAKWQNVSFGENNLAAPEQLFQDLVKD